MRGVGFESCDVANDVDAAAGLRALGLRSVPVVALANAAAGGKEFAFGVDLRAVAELVGVPFQASPALPAEELKQRLKGALDVAMRLASEFPPDRLRDKLPRRNRTCLGLANHLVEIAAVFLRVCAGSPFDVEASSAIPQTELGVADLRVRAKAVTLQLDEAEVEGSRTVETFFGPQALHLVLERCAWHTMQHARQLEMMLTRTGAAPKQPITPQLLADLPLPRAVWD